MRASEAREAVVREHSDDLLRSERLRFAAEQIVAISRGELLTTNSQQHDRRRQAEARFEASLAHLTRTAHTPRARELLDEVQTDARAYRIAIEDSVSTRRDRAASNAEIEAVFAASLQPARLALEESLARFVSYKNELLESAYDRARGIATHASYLIVGLGALGLLSSSALVWRGTLTLNRLYASERRSAHRAREATADREEVLQILAHDLRSPLNAVMMKATLLSAGPPSERSVAQAESIERIVLRMGQIIEGLLDAATIADGRLTLEVRRLEARELAAGAIEMLEALAAAKSIPIEAVDLAPDLVLADPHRMHQALANLIDHAIRSTPEGGTITIAVRRTGDEVRFEVTDAGAGIADVDLPHVFERHRDGRRGSRGLGLHVAKCIIEAHGGRIAVERRTGRGNTFWFTLPRAIDPAHHTPGNLAPSRS
jgi:signal transduction histidine kinase